MKNRAAIYLRVSKEDQADPDRYSLPSQRRICMRAAQENGLEVAAFYVDDGASAYLDGLEHRPYFRAMLQDAQEGRFGVVIALAVDRFSRNVADGQRWFKVLERSGARFLSATEWFDASPAGQFTRNILLDAAQLDSQIKSVKVRAALEERARAGHFTGFLPYGYKRAEKGEIVADEAEAAGYALMVRRAWGAENFREVAQALNAAGYRSKTGKLWTGHAVARTLRNPFYYGSLRFHGEVVPGEHDPLIDYEEWKRLQQRTEQITRCPIRRRHESQVYILSGIGRCPRCDSPLYGHSISRGRWIYRAYTCARRIRLGSDPALGGCDLRNLRAPEAEAEMDSIICCIELPPSWQDEVLALLEEPLAPVVSQEAIEAKLHRLTWLYQEGDVSQADYKRRRAELLRMLDQARPPARVSILEAGKLLSDVGEVWRKSEAEERKGLVRALFDAVYLDGAPKEPRIVRIVPKPEVAPLWALVVQYGTLPKVFAMQYGAKFPWLSDPDVATHACPDAHNPVVFEIVRLDEIG